MKKLYWVKTQPGVAALMRGDDMLYVTTPSIARKDAREFNKAAEQSVQRTICPACAGKGQRTNFEGLLIKCQWCNGTGQSR